MNNTLYEEKWRSLDNRLRSQMGLPEVTCFYYNLQPDYYFTTDDGDPDEIEINVMKPYILQLRMFVNKLSKHE